MKLSVKWLSDYTDVNCSTNELVEKLTMAGIEVESVDKIGDNISGVIAVKIVDARPHPNADRLKLCDVSDGRNTFSVVCGAPNCRTGIVAALAAPGATLPAGQVRKANIRGVKSAGMLVSRRELGISDDHSGIMELPADTKLGEDLLAAMDLTDTVLDISITPNRPDWLSVLGLAREVAAALGKKAVKRPEVKLQNAGGEIDSFASVEIADPDLCPRYTGLLVKGVKVGPSPSWMSQRLEAAGVRSINNIVDITNFVQLEVGQPLHAFDYHFLADHKIIVRRAKKGETIITLDERERKLDGEALLICDGEKPVALAGVMGGQNSLVTDDTQDVFIESAFFNPSNIRRTSKGMGLSTESSYRFERGVDIDGVAYAAHRAALLMVELGGGTLIEGFIDNYPGKPEPKKLKLRAWRANHLLGTAIDAESMAGYLRAIDLPTKVDGDDLEVTIPTFRVDLDREVDLIEEVARLHGFENIKATLPSSSGVTPTVSDERKIELAVRDILVSIGMNEAINYSFTSAMKLDWFRGTPGTYVKLQNPINEDYAVLRDTLLPGLCQNLAGNLNRQAKRVALFEIRRTFRPKLALRELPDEQLHVAGILAGRRYEEGWAFENAGVDFFDLKGIIEELLEQLSITDSIEWRPGKAYHLSPKANAELIYKGRVLGSLGLLSKKVAKQFDLQQNSWVFELNLSMIKSKVMPTVQFASMSKFPVTTRDIAIVVNKSIKAGQIIDTIYHSGPDLVRDVICFDVYKGDKLASNEKSLAFSIRLQKLEGEVSEIEAEQLVRKCLGMLMQRFEAKLRE